MRHPWGCYLGAELLSAAHRFLIIVSGFIFGHLAECKSRRASRHAAGRSEKRAQGLVDDATDGRFAFPKDFKSEPRHLTLLDGSVENCALLDSDALSIGMNFLE
jgi:hypothetical protein